LITFRIGYDHPPIPFYAEGIPLGVKEKQDKMAPDITLEYSRFDA